MMWQILIVFRSHLSYLGKVVPRTGWEVMMFDVIADIHVGNVPQSQVVIGLLSFNELEMFCDDVCCCRMRTN